jgi:Tol biopolymer transport system component
MPVKAAAVLFMAAGCAATLLPGCGGGPGPAEAEVTSVRVLTLDGGRLDWSPDGRRLAFDRFDPTDGYADVWVMNTDGTGERCLTCDHAALGLPAGHKGNPVWHPGGNWIVFQAEMAEHPAGPMPADPSPSAVAKPGYGMFDELWAIRADGSAARKILSLDISQHAEGTLHPCFNAVGDRLAWSHMVKGPPAAYNPNLSPGEWRIRVAPFSLPNDVPTLGAWEEHVPGVPAFYETHAFSADGSGLLFSGNPDPGQTLLGMDEAILDLRSGAIRRRVTDTPLEWDEHAHFAPHSSNIVFASSRGLPPSAADPHADLWVIDTGGARRQLTFFNDPAWRLRPAALQPWPSVFTADGAFSPDGHRFASFLLLDARAQNGAIVVLGLSPPM